MTPTCSCSAGRPTRGWPATGIAIFGSPSLTVSLIELGLVDELRVLASPIVLGDGRSLFRSGNVLLTYRPA